MKVIAESEDEIGVVLTKHEFRLLGSYVGGTDSDTVDNDKGLSSIWRQYTIWCCRNHLDTTIFDVSGSQNNAFNFVIKKNYKNEM